MEQNILWSSKMKLQVIKPNQEPISGYETVVLTDTLDLSHVIANSCESVFCPDICDMFPAVDLAKGIEALVSKMRIGASIVLGGTDIRAFSKNVSNGLVPLLEASNIVGICRSMTTPDSIIQVFSSLGLNIESVNIDGIHYEVKARRS